MSRSGCCIKSGAKGEEQGREMECEDMRSKLCLYIYSSDNDRLPVLIAVKKDLVWNDYRGSRNAE
jgi:hypothetical protein